MLAAVVDYFDFMPDPRSLDARDWDEEVDATSEDERDPLVKLQQEIEALYAIYLDRLPTGERKDRPCICIQVRIRHGLSGHS